MKRTMALLLVMGILVAISAGCEEQDDKLRADVTLQHIADQLKSELGEWYVQMAASVEESSLQDLFSIEPAWVTDFAGAYSITMTSADHFIAIHAKDGYAEEVRQALENRRAQLEQTFAEYLPEPYRVAQAGKVLVRGDYVFLIMLGDPTQSPARTVARAEEIINSFFEENSGD